jgi:hypothetical protein
MSVFVKGLDHLFLISQPRLRWLPTRERLSLFAQGLNQLDHPCNLGSSVFFLFARFSCIQPVQKAGGFGLTTVCPLSRCSVMNTYAIHVPQITTLLLLGQAIFALYPQGGREMANDFVDLAITDFVIVDEALYSIRGSAQALGGISRFTVERWLSEGKLLRTKVGGRTMIRGSELRRILVDGGKSPGRPRLPTGNAVPAVDDKPKPSK